MRDIATILRRVQADLPITDEEVAIAHRHLDGVIARHRKIERGVRWFITFGGIVLFLVLLSKGCA